jgi:hypothetical protein
MMCRYRVLLFGPTSPPPLFAAPHFFLVFFELFFKKNLSANSHGLARGSLLILQPFFSSNVVDVAGGVVAVAARRRHCKDSNTVGYMLQLQWNWAAEGKALNSVGGAVYSIRSAKSNAISAATWPLHRFQPTP